MKQAKRTRKMYRAIASAIQSRTNCIAMGSKEGFGRWNDMLDKLQNLLPSGSGIDNGTKILVGECRFDRIVLKADFRHTDEQGRYDGWTEHRITVRPDFLSDFALTVSGQNRNDVKDYLSDVFYSALADSVTDYADGSVRLGPI